MVCVGVEVLNQGRQTDVQKCSGRGVGNQSRIDSGGVSPPGTGGIRVLRGVRERTRRWTLIMDPVKTDVPANTRLKITDRTSSMSVSTN